MPIQVQCDACQAEYRLADSMAGKRVRCKSCGAAILVPSFAPPIDEGESITDLSDVSSSLGSSGESDWSSEANPFDIGASMRELKGRVAARPITLYRFPFADMIDSLLPWALIGMFLVPALWQTFNGIRALHTPWVGWSELIFAAILYFALVLPLTCRGLRSAAKAFKYRLPDSISFRVFAAFCVPVGLGAFFYNQLSWSGFYFGFGLGVFIAVILLGIEFSLLPVEILLSAGFIAGFYVATSIAVMYVTTWVEPVGTLLVTSINPPKKEPIKKPQPVAKKEQTPATPVTLAPEPVAPAAPVAPEIKAEPKPDTAQPQKEVIKPTSPAIVAIDALDAPVGFDQMLHSAGSSKAMAVIRHGGNEDQIESWSLDPVKEIGSASLKHSGNDRCIISPNGDLFARLANWPKLSALVWSFSSQSLARTIELNEKFGTPDLAAFVTNDQLAVKFDRGGLVGLELWDVRGVRAARQVPMPAYANNSLSFSSDGRFAAIAVKSDGTQPNAVLLYDLSAPRTPRRFNITGLDPRLPLTVAGATFSNDSQKFALLCENDDNLLIECWQLMGGTSKPIYEHVFPAGVLPLSNLSSYPGRAFSWLDKQTWLLYGQVVIDMTTGKSLANLNIPQVRDQQVIDDQTLILEYQNGQNANALMQVKLDLGVLEDARNK